MAPRETYYCYVQNCPKKSIRVDEFSRHFNIDKAHPHHEYSIAKVRAYNAGEIESESESESESDSGASVMERPQREKKPTEKAKASTSKPQSENKDFVVPPVYQPPPDDPKFAVAVKEIPKIYD